ncbi:MAG: HD-GYP domain-containing protein [Spirochaetaceae bacterium]|nr:HD-GYP domain-containing protein [Spirochaetaceae bacterium]
MKKLRYSALSPGMSFSAPLYFDDEKNMFLAEGVKLKDRDLKAMEDWNISYVVTDGHLLDDGGSGVSSLPDVKLLIMPEVASDSGLYRRYLNLIEDMSVFFTNVREGISVSQTDVDIAVSEIATLIAEDRVEVMSFILGGESVDGYAKSSVNVAILSIVMAERLEYVHRHIIQLITGALLHDIGMMCISESITNKNGELSDDEMKLMKTHPLHGYRFIVNQLYYPAEIGNMALQHHERWDGKGYPDGRVGKQIDMGARIISVADAFEAMVSRKSWREPMLGYDAMKNLLGDNSRRFDPNVLKAFIQGVGIYPIGSLVLLNNGAICRIIESNFGAPLRPRLRVFLDSTEKAYPGSSGPVLNLMEDKSLFITRVLDPRDFEGHNGG